MTHPVLATDVMSTFYIRNQYPAVTQRSWRNKISSKFSPEYDTDLPQNLY